MGAGGTSAFSSNYCHHPSVESQDSTMKDQPLCQKAFGVTSTTKEEPLCQKGSGVASAAKEEKMPRFLLDANNRDWIIVRCLFLLFSFLLFINCFRKIIALR